MTRAEIAFTIIDALTHHSQNCVKFPGVEAEKNVAYSAEFASDRVCDVYRTAEAGAARPVFVNIHGGGFVKGDKKHRQSFCAMVASRGFVVFNINHRLSPKHPFPAPIEDFFEFFRYLPTVAEKYGLDLGRVVVSGDSSGAYCAMAVAVASCSALYREKLGVGDFPAGTKVVGFLGCCGPYDLMQALAKPAPLGLTRSIAQSFTGLKLPRRVALPTDYKYTEVLSASHFIDKSWDLNTFLIYSKKDILCAGQGEYVCNLLDTLGVKYGSFHSEKFFDNHCFHLFMRTKKAKECLKAVVPWLDGIASEGLSLDI